MREISRGVPGLEDSYDHDDMNFAIFVGFALGLVCGACFTFAFAMWFF